MKEHLEAIAAEFDAMQKHIVDLQTQLGSVNEKLLATQKVLDDAMKAEAALHTVVTGSPE